MLGFLGYEIIVRESSPYRRYDDEIVINNNPEFVERSDIDKIEVKEEKKEVKTYRNTREYVMGKAEGKEYVNKKEAAEILKMNYPTMIKRYGHCFVGNKISVDRLVEIIDRGSIPIVKAQINNAKSEYMMIKPDEELANEIRRRIDERIPGKVFLTRVDIATITGLTRQTVYTHFNKYFTENSITINEFITAFQVEGIKLK